MKRRVKIGEYYQRRTGGTMWPVLVVDYWEKCSMVHFRDVDMLKLTSVRAWCLEEEAFLKIWKKMPDLRAKLMYD